MALLQRLLLLPLLAPLLAVLLVGALNPKPSLNLRLLIWTSPGLPIGVWIALAAAGGAGLSAAGASLALWTGAGSQRRQVRRPLDDNDRMPPPGREPQVPQPVQAAGPPRPPGDPAPTVAVPFRVIRKGRNSAASPMASQAPTSPEPVKAQAAAVGDGWDRPSNDDW
ncbi:MAG: hypothetical protein WD136_04485 [Cyanobium sp.]